MIITAKVARNQATTKTFSGFKNSQIRALRKVEKAINRCSKKGKTSMQYPPLNNIVMHVLKENGYKIRSIGGYDTDWIVIFWD